MNEKQRKFSHFICPSFPYIRMKSPISCSSCRSTELRRRTVWMGDIAADWSTELIQSFFANCSKCLPNVIIKLNARSGWTHANGIRVGFALIEFASEEEARFVLETFADMPIPGIENCVFNLKTNYWSGAVSPTGTTSTSTVETDDFSVERMDNKYPLEPPLHIQLEPLTMSQLRDRLNNYGVEFAQAESIAMKAGGRVGKKAELIRLLCKHYCEQEPSLRQRIFMSGVPVDNTLLQPLLQCLRATQWGLKTRNVTAAEYLVLGIPAANAAPKNTGNYPELWRLCGQLMNAMAPAFEYSSVAVTRNFTGSPHVDMGDRCYQYAISLGDFHSGGELCVETSPNEVCIIDTHGKLARMDGRFPHWVRSFEGERFSLIFYRITGPSVSPTQAVYSTL